MLHCHLMAKGPDLTSHLLHGEITGQVIGAFYRVYNSLGGGFAERVYQRALARELRSGQLLVETETPISVDYGGEAIGELRSDLIVERKVLVEIKATTHLQPAYTTQLLNYLRASGIEVGLLLNFGRRAEFRRLILTSR